MSEPTKYTPGPWSACDEGKCACKMVMSKDYPVATVTAGKWGDSFAVIKIEGTPESCTGELKLKAEIDLAAYGEVSEETAQANARLIAAAPELLEACKLYRAALIAAGKHGARIPDIAAVELVHADIVGRAAIAKATPPKENDHVLSGNTGPHP